MSVCMVVLRLELPFKARSPVNFDFASKYCIHCYYAIHLIVMSANVANTLLIQPNVTPSKSTSQLSLASTIAKQNS